MDKICGVISFEGFQVDKSFLVREFGYISVNWDRGRSFRYDLTKFADKLSQKDWERVDYVEDNIFGMPFYPLEGEVVYPLKYLDGDILEFYDYCKTRERNIVAYIGGQAEQKRLHKLRIPNVNLEIFGCPKYDRLQARRYRQFSCGFKCGYHEYDLHCPRAEVTAFKDWIRHNLMTGTPQSGDC